MSYLLLFLLIPLFALGRRVQGGLRPFNLEIPRGYVQIVMSIVPAAIVTEFYLTNGGLTTEGWTMIGLALIAFNLMFSPGMTDAQNKDAPIQGPVEGYRPDRRSVPYPTLPKNWYKSYTKSYVFVKLLWDAIVTNFKKDWVRPLTDLFGVGVVSDTRHLFRCVVGFWLPALVLDVLCAYFTGFGGFGLVGLILGFLYYKIEIFGKPGSNDDTGWWEIPPHCRAEYSAGLLALPFILIAIL